MIEFKVNNVSYSVNDIDPNTTVLEYLRNTLNLVDAKEGCASGDCGACTILVKKSVNKNNSAQYYTINSCITLLSLMNDCQLFTASYLADNPTYNQQQAKLHPAQQALVECHGSQCGFCTPGFVMSLACLYENKKTTTDNADHHYENSDLKDTVINSISGNLCRCTGYRPIVDAGLKMFELEKSCTLADKLKVENNNLKDTDDIALKSSALSSPNQTNAHSLPCPAPALQYAEKKLFIPNTLSELERLLALYPDALLWAGGTDLGLTITQQFVEHRHIIQLSEVAPLNQWSFNDNELIIGAGMTYAQLKPVLEQYFPEFAKIIKRIASPQIRNMGTIGGNIANASPIGDLPPILLALDAKVHIRYCGNETAIPSSTIDDLNDVKNVHNTENVNTTANIQDTAYDDIIPLNEFFIGYKQTKLKSGSYLAAIHIPLLSENQHLTIHKISKRYEDDISACLLALRVDVNDTAEMILDARVGLGGMAAVPLLAETSQLTLKDSPFSIESFKACAASLAKDVTPISDVRASREYRLKVIQRLIIQSGKRLCEKYETN